MTPQAKHISRRNIQYDWLAKTIAEYDSDECLLWPFHTDRNGYGRVRPPLKEYGRITFGAHRLAFKFKYGHWPEHLGTHSCYTPGCINPKHIKDGTNASNQKEKADRARSVRGTDQKGAKLTDEIVRNIKREYKPRKMGFHRLANKYGVTKPIIRSI